jgi:hypothetical protein
VTGVTGLVGLPGVQGATGTAGATGPAFANLFANGTVASASTIANASTNFYHFIDNTAGAVSVTLPSSAATAGKVIHIQGRHFSNGVTNRITVNRQGADQIFLHLLTTAGNPVNSHTVNFYAEYVSDGNGRWLLTIAQ